MKNAKRLVAFACVNPARDPCAHLIFTEIAEMAELRETELVVDDFPVMRVVRQDGATIDIVRTLDVVAHDYARYLPLMNLHWGDCAAALVLNWHEGANAPDRIFPVHTTGDVATGVFGVSDPVMTRSVLMAIETARLYEGLVDWRTVTEATHWSGVVHASAPRLITEYRVPVLDVEIGSSPACWSDRVACRVIAHATLNALDHRIPVKNVLFVGGVHFEPTCRDAAVTAAYGAVSFGHILANHWVNGGDYSGDTGVQHLLAAAGSVAGGVVAMFFHDSLKGPVKQAVRDAGARLGIPVYVHRKLREPPFEFSRADLSGSGRVGALGQIR